MILHVCAAGEVFLSDHCLGRERFRECVSVGARACTSAGLIKKYAV